MVGDIHISKDSLVITDQHLYFGEGAGFFMPEINLLSINKVLTINLHLYILYVSRGNRPFNNKMEIIMSNTRKEFLIKEINETLKNKEHWIAMYGKDDAEVKNFDKLLENLHTALANER